MNGKKHDLFCGQLTLIALLQMLRDFHRAFSIPCTCTAAQMARHMLLSTLAMAASAAVAAAARAASRSVTVSETMRIAGSARMVFSRLL